MKYNYCFYCGGELSSIEHKEKNKIVLVKSLKKYYPEIVKNVKEKCLVFCPDCYTKLNKKIQNIRITGE